jgi:hypothetical protein
MKSTSFEAGREEMREQLVALVYHNYCHQVTFHGKDSEQALILKNLIKDIRHDQAEEYEQVPSN